MVKETITYHDLDGNEITEDFWFNMFSTEIAEWNFEKTGGLEEYVKKLQAEEDPAKIIQFIKEIILKSFGKRSEDGLRFIKSDADAIAFSQTEAFHVLFLKLAQDEKEASRFINGIVPNMPQDNKIKKLPTKTTTKKD